MAKTILNSALKRISGKIDNWVYRKYGDGVIITRPPEFSGPPSPAQLGVRERFRLAAAYAKEILADPVRLAPYAAAAARARMVSVFAFVMGDFLKPPAVDAIDLAGYHGNVGDLIKVSASDGFKVAAVHVVLRDAAGVIQEEGPATLTDGRWTYAATTWVTAGETVTIEATATDVPGHTGSQTAPFTTG